MADNLKPISPIKLCINVTIPSIDDGCVSLYEAVGVLTKKMQEAIEQINNSLGTLEGAYSENNPPPYPVTSVNGQTGAVVVDVPENVYSSDNPPPYPVTSVDGKTGNVTVDIPVKSVNSAVTANIQTLFVPEGTTSGTLDDITQEELIAACKAGATLAAVDTDNKTFKLYHLAYFIDPERVEYYELAQGESAVTSVNGKDGQVVLNGADIAVSNADATKLSTKIANIEGDIADVDAKADEAYSPNNAPPYPVTSVNNQTGVIDIYSESINALKKTEFENVISTNLRGFAEKNTLNFNIKGGDCLLIISWQDQGKASGGCAIYCVGYGKTLIASETHNGATGSLSGNFNDGYVFITNTTDLGATGFMYNIMATRNAR